MTKLICILAAGLLSSALLAAESPSEVEKPPVRSGKRSKKIAICPKCGRPEPKCECEDGKHDESDKKKSIKTETQSADRASDD